jgi:predicted amidohydrolase
MRIAVIQHRLRAHERQDLAALLALAEQASDDGATVIVCPGVPGLRGNTRVFNAFLENMRTHAPGSLVISPLVAEPTDGASDALLTPLGRTLALVGDACIDPALHDRICAMSPQAMVWQADAESALQAEAVLELALDASLSLAGLVVIAANVGGSGRTAGFGGSAIVHLGEIVAEAGEEEDVVIATIDVPVELPDRPGPLPVLPPILAQRLAHHHGTRPLPDWPADLTT